MKKIVIANWKMNPETESEAKKMARYSDRSGVVVCPPYGFLPAVKKTLKKSSLGAQDVFWGKGSGPFTGEMSVLELKDLGVKYVIVGHSERRKYFNETDEVIARKVVAVINAGLVPILCLGENSEERSAGKEQEVVDRQLKAVLSQLPAGGLPKGVSFLVAYEPVWAISTNAAASGLADLASDQAPEVGAQMIKYLRRVSEPFGVKIKFIYGGSVDPGNVAELIQHDEIEGFLVGGASLKKQDFLSILEAALGR